MPAQLLGSPAQGPETEAGSYRADRATVVQDSEQHIGFMLGVFVGLGDGPLFWLIGGAVYTLLGVVLLAVARRRGLMAGVWTGPTR